MAIECAYSFSDLYFAAHGREPSPAELEQLYALSQEERNQAVREWAGAAGWEVRQRIGTNGIAYLAFAPRF